MLQPKKTNNGLSESDNEILVKELTNYANDGASDQELQEFRDTFISTKKKSTANSGSTTQPQKKVSEQTTGSSGTIGQNNYFGPAFPSTQPKKQKTATTASDTASQFSEGSMAWTHEKIKNDPEYTLLYNRLKQAEAIPEDKINEIKQDVDNEASSTGVWNNIVSGAKKAWNTTTDVLTTIGTLGTETSGPESLKANTTPLYDERKQAKEEIQKQQAAAKANKQPVQPITEEVILDRAKQIAVDKRIKSQRESQTRSFLEDAENTTSGIGGMNDRQKLAVFEIGRKSTLQEKDKTLLKKQNLLRPAIDYSVNTLQTIQKEADAYNKAGQPVPQELKDQYDIVYAGYQEQISDALETHNEYLSNQKNLGKAIENIDVFKRDYSWSKNFENNILATTMDLIGGGFGLGDYINTVAPGMSPTSAYNALQFRSLSRKFRSEAQEVRDEVMKPIAVEDINSLDDFGSWLANTAVASQIPIYAMIATGNVGIAGIGLTSTGQKFEDMQSENEAGTSNYSAAQMTGIPLAFGVTETASAMVDRMLLNSAVRAIRSTTAPERKLMADGFAKQIFNGAKKIGGATLKGTTYEGVDEGLTQLSQNLIDIYAGDKKTVGIWDNVKDAAAAGAAMGFLLPFGGEVMSMAVKPFSVDNNIQKTSADILKLEQTLENPEISESSRITLTEQLDKSEAKLNALVKKTVRNVEHLSDKQFQEVIALEKKQASLKESARELKADPNVDEDIKKASINDLKNEFKETNQNRIGILEKPTTEANEEPAEDSNDTTITTTESGASQENITENTEAGQTNNESATEENTYLKAITDKLDTLYETLLKNGNSEADAERIAIESLSEEERQTLLGRQPNTQQNETVSETNSSTDGDISVGATELGEMGEEGQSAAGTVVGESSQSAVESGTSESQPEVDSRIEEIESRRQNELTELQNNPDAIEDNGSYYIPGDNGVETSTDLINEKYDSEIASLPVVEIKSEQPTVDRPATFEKKKGEKSVVNRLYEGETSDTIKKVAEDSGLTYEVESQEQAQKKSKAFVEKVGINGALEAVRTGVVKGAEKAFVYADILDKIQEASDNADTKQREKVEEQYLAVLTEATNMFDQEARDSGRFISALNRIYNNSKIKYSLSRQIERYKAANNGDISDAVLAKFKEADAKIKELEAKISEVEKRAEEAEQKAAMQNIINNIEQQASKKPYTNKQKAKKVANNIRKLKITKPDAFNAATAGIVWDAAVEIVAKTVETGGTVADGINKAITYVKKTKWYKGLSDDKKKDAENQFRRSVLDSEDNNVPQVTVEDGVIYIPEAVIRNYVESGIKDIDSLSQAILDTISESHPEITLRDVRDAITKYGKTVNPTKDDLQKEINQMKRLGRLISGLEDVDSGQRPLRSGLQREKPSQEERKMQRELREKMRDLPLDHADLDKQWKTALDTIKSRLNNQIEDLEKQIEAGEKRKPERTSIQYDSEALALKERRDELRNVLDEITGKPELTDEQKIQRAINITENSIEKLRKQIESGDIGFNPTPRTLSSPELDALKETRKTLTDDLNKMRQEAGLIEERKLKQAKDRVNKRIKELQDKIANRDYSKKEFKPVTADNELIQLQAEKIRQQEIYDKAAYEIELKNRSLREKSREAIVGALNIFRILKATGELSPVLIQGGIRTINNLVTRPKVLLKALAKLFVAFGSSRKAEQYDAIMKANPNYGIMKASKLGLVEPDYKLELREEQFIGNYINNIWNALGKFLENASGKIFNVTETMPVGDKILSFFNDEYRSMPKQRISEQFKNLNPLLALERGLTTYMNELRMDRFNDGVTMLEMEGKNISDNKKDYEKLASAINSLTGRANIGRLTNVSDILNTIFFSFRNTVSIINQINPYWYATLKSPNDPWYKPSVAQKIAVYDMIRFITITTSMMYLLKAAAGDDEEGKPIIEIETDPRSSDFLKMKDGNMRFDAFHGMIPMVVFFARQFTGQTKSKGEVKDLGSGMFTPTRADLLVNMGANKLSPQAGIAYRFANTKLNKKGERVNKFGEPYDLAKELSITPIYAESLKEIAKEDPDAYAQFLAFMGIFGVNSQVYESKTAANKKAGKKLSPETKKTIEDAKKRAKETLKNR